MGFREKKLYISRKPDPLFKQSIQFMIDDYESIGNLLASLDSMRGSEQDDHMQSTLKALRNIYDTNVSRCIYWIDEE